MKRTLLIIGNDLKRRLKSPLSVIVLLAVPVVMTALIGSIFAPREGESILPRIKILAVDNDKTPVSKILLAAFDNPSLKDMFQVTQVTESEGKKLMSDGKASALLVIPEGFGAKLLKAEEVELELIKNPSEQFLPEVVEEFLRTLAVIVSGFVQVFETELKAIDALLTVDLQNVPISAMVPFLETGKAKIEALAAYLDPLLLELKTEQEKAAEAETTAGPDLNVFAYIMPGMAILFLLFIVEIFMRDLLAEREDGKTRRMMFSPLSGGELILARIVSGTAAGLLAFFVMTAFGSAVFSIKWGPFPSLLLLAAVTCFWTAAFFGLLAGFFRNRNQAAVFTAPIILVFGVFGGSIIPVEAIPAGLRWISKISINHWFISAAGDIRAGLFPTTALLVIGCSAALLFALAVPVLNKRIAR